jgi:tyrosyl-tRNA synthetase
MQGYDYYWLYKNQNCKLQMGGSDQWGNITTGTELIRRKAGGEAFAFTCPLITKSDGGKFGKTEKGNVWLDPEKTSPFQFYQFWLNAADADAEKWIRIFTFLPKDEVDELSKRHNADPSARILQKKLAEEVTTFVHGENEYKLALETTAKLFSNQAAPVESMSVEDLEGLDGVVKFDYSANKIKVGTDVITFLSECGIFASKGEARRMVQSGGVSINRNKIDNPQTVVTDAMLLHEKYMLVQKGKKNYYLVKVE